MAGWHPLKRREFVRRLRALGFVGPDRGTRHEFLVCGRKRQTIPSNSEFSSAQVVVLLRQAGAVLGRTVTQEEWERL